MRLVSWNVNGIRACLRRGFMDFFNQSGSDFFCLQETRVQPGQVELELPGYEQYWNYALQKKGYSGTAIFTRHTPISQSYGIGHEEHDQEGRTITLEYDNFYLVTVYTPNSQRGLTRLGYRMRWEDDFRRYLLDLNTAKPVIVCGDLNVAHKEIDLKTPKPTAPPQASPLKKEPSSLSFWKPDLSTHSAISTLTAPMPTLGGQTSSMPGNGISGGESTIS